MAAHDHPLDILNLNPELLVLVLQNTSLMKQWTLRRLCKHLQVVVNDQVWPRNKTIKEEDFKNVADSEMRKIWLEILPRMPKIKYFSRPDSVTLKRGTRRVPELGELLAEHCREITRLEPPELVNLYVSALCRSGTALDISERQFVLEVSNVRAFLDIPGVKIAVNSGQLMNLRCKGVVYKVLVTSNSRYVTIPDSVKVLQVYDDVLEDPNWKIPKNIECLTIYLGRSTRFTNFEKLTYLNLDSRYYYEKTMLKELINLLSRPSCRIVHLKIRLEECFDRFLSFIINSNRFFEQLVITGLKKLVYQRGQLVYESNSSFKTGLKVVRRLLSCFPKVRTIVIIPSNFNFRETEPFRVEQIDAYKTMLEILSRPNKKHNYMCILVSLLLDCEITRYNTLAVGDNWILEKVEMQYNEHNLMYNTPGFKPHKLWHEY